MSRIRRGLNRTTPRIGSGEWADAATSERIKKGTEIIELLGKMPPDKMLGLERNDEKKGLLYYQQTGADSWMPVETEVVSVVPNSILKAEVHDDGMLYMTYDTSKVASPGHNGYEADTIRIDPLILNWFSFKNQAIRLLSSS